MFFKSNFRFPFRQRSSIPHLISQTAVISGCCHKSRMPVLTPSRSSVRSVMRQRVCRAPHVRILVSLQSSSSWQTGLDQLEAPPCARSRRYKTHRDMRFARTAAIEKAWRAN